MPPAMIDRERGVILSEKRERDSSSARIAAAQTHFLYRGTLIPERSPIGLTDAVRYADRPGLLAFYRRWYRPDRVTVVAVGDIDPAALVRRIGEHFGQLAADGPPPADPELGLLVPGDARQFLYYPSPTSESGLVSVACVIPNPQLDDTRASRREWLYRFLAFQMLARRFEVLANRKGALFTVQNIGSEPTYGAFVQSQITLGCRRDKWQEILELAQEELRRALQFGFFPEEYADAAANVRNGIEQNVLSAGARQSPSLADALSRVPINRTVFISPAQDRDLLRPLLDRGTPDDCLRALRDVWPAVAPRKTFVSGCVFIPASATNAIAAVYDRAEAEVLKPWEPPRIKPWSYTSFGPPGAVARRNYRPDLDATLIAFQNGVRLNLKRTTFEAGLVDVSIRLGGGELTEPSREPGLGLFTQTAFLFGGLGRHSNEDIRRLFASHTVTLSFAVGEDAFQLFGVAGTRDLEIELQAMAAEISDPGYRAEAPSLARGQIASVYTNYEHTVAGPIEVLALRALANGDHRVGEPTYPDFLSRTPREEKAWLGPQLASGPIEITLVGDLDPEAAIAAVSRTLGALPKRTPKPSYASLRQIGFPARPFALRYQISSPVPQGLAAVFWPTAGGFDYRRYCQLELLGQVLSDRLRVRLREQRGVSYSPQVQNLASDAYPGFGYLLAQVASDPASCDSVRDQVVGIAAEVARDGVTPDELERARKPALAAVENAVRTNTYWVAALARIQESPDTEVRPLHQAEFLREATVADLNALARRYLPANRAFLATVTTGSAR